MRPLRQAALTFQQDGYAKLREYINNKLWPEVDLYRERFGYLPEFPPKDGAEDEETKPENSIKYWQDKLQGMEAENRSLNQTLIVRNEQIANFQLSFAEQNEQLSALEKENADYQEDAAESARRVSELEFELQAAKNELDDHERLVEEGESSGILLDDSFAIMLL